ncbi:hypothetical protein P691DRAFT_808678 [Macrolepiota fuliginosa MF-IS2]|uniref:Uncharacterized protein n=1 Tax=Macrolepiota fuliginosa MF-IS2 TaxID=1400762 RepID=A0A9P5X5B4_9AGAR|nr:hypothetical protein P691DRAFT_808678 [Macrolepiota fuliginosa MF-IS2]
MWEGLPGGRIAETAWGLVACIFGFQLRVDQGCTSSTNDLVVLLEVQWEPFVE